MQKTLVEKIRESFEVMDEDFEIFQCFIDNPECVSHIKRFMVNIRNALSTSTTINLLTNKRHLDGYLTDKDCKWLDNATHKIDKNS